MNKKEYYIQIFKIFPLIILGLGVIFFVGFSPTICEGMEYLFLLPLSLTVCLIAFSQIFFFHKGGIGLKILYLTIIVKYYIMPVLMVIDSQYYGSKITIINGNDYRVAIVIMIIELFTACITISLTYDKLKEKINNEVIQSNVTDSKMHIGGLAVIIALIGIMVLRGNSDEILPAMRFFLATEKLEDVPFDSYSIIALQAMKSFITITVIAWASEKGRDSTNKIYLIIALIISILNCSIYFGNNRSSVLQTAIATIAILLFAFKKDRKAIVITVIPVVAAIMYSFIMIKQFGVDVTQNETAQTTNFSDLVQTIDAYTCGVRNIASTHAKYLAATGKFGIFDFFKDITDNIFLFKVPGFTFVNNFFADNIASTRFILGESTAMLPVYGQMLCYGTEYFAWLLDIIAYIVVIRCLVIFDLKAKIQINLQKKFIYTWLASLFGLIMCYCLITLLWSFSNTPFFLIILFYINSKIKIGKSEF